MSRRRPKLPELPGPEYTRNQSVKAICTDREQHAPVVLHYFSDYRGVLLDEDLLWVEGGRNGSPLAGWTRKDGVRTFRFRCPACPADRRLTEANLFRVLDGLASLRHGDDRPVFDISLLP